MKTRRCGPDCRSCARERRLGRAADLIAGLLAAALIYGGARVAAVFGMVR